ncbi:PspA/IM30 family protein [Desulfothermus okinawensis JCM 13304]
MGILSRFFKIGQAEAHHLADKLEDPVKLTEQGIRDLKKNLSQAMSALAEVKASMIRFQREAENEKKRAVEYVKKAEILLSRTAKGEVDQAEAEKLSTELLEKAERFDANAKRLEQEAEAQRKMADNLNIKVRELKSQISKYEAELKALKARAATAKAVKKVNKQMAKVDSSSTISMLERMKQKVEEEESLAQAYGDIVGEETSLEDKVDDLIKEDRSASLQKLEELKKKVGLS